MHIGVNIKKFRKERGLTQKELSEKINKSTITVRKYEANDTTPPIDVLRNIADVLDLTVQEFVTGERQEIKIVEKDITQFTTEELLKEIYRRTIMED